MINTEDKLKDNNSAMEATYTNKFNRTQSVKVIRNEGNYTLCINEKGTYFYAVTKGLKFNK